MEDSKEKSFVIKDKRIFSETGDVKQDEPSRPEAEHIAPEKPQTQEAPEAQPKEPPGEAFIPEINFSNFILSLSTTAMFHFGDFPDPVTKKSERNLTAAKQTIDLLAMLKTKTAGNLDENEGSLIDGLLFELRMRYVREKDRP